MNINNIGINTGIKNNYECLTQNTKDDIGTKSLDTDKYNLNENKVSFLEPEKAKQKKHYDNYIKHFDSISNDYTREIFSSHSRVSDSILSPSDAILKLEDVYNIAKEDIMKNLKGEKQKERLEQLDKAYKENSQNIVNRFASFTNHVISGEMLFEKMRTMISEKAMFSDRLSKESQNMLKESYKRFDGIKNDLNILKEAVLNLHNKDNALTDILKLTNQITKGMNENLSKTYKIELKNKDEINKLNLEKAKLYDYDYKNMTDEEKYQQLAKNKKKIESINKKIDKLLENEIR